MVKEEEKHKRSEISSKDEPVVWRDTRLRDGRHVDVFTTKISDAWGLSKVLINLADSSEQQEHKTFRHHAP